MAGIISFGAYVPVHRLPRSVIAESWQERKMPGEKAVANYDEDSLTMAVAAARRCLAKVPSKQVDALYCATTTAPYREKQSGALIAAVLGLPEDTRTVDFGNSLRCGTSAIGAALNAIDAGAAECVLVCISDLRQFRPKSSYEMFCGDGAVAVLLGKEDVVAEVERFDSGYDEIQDVWRTDRERFIRTAEDRFVQDLGYCRVMKNGVEKTLKRHGLEPGSFSKVCPNFSNARTIGRLFGRMGFSPEEQLQLSLAMDIGDTGSPMALMNLAAALEDAEPQQRILVANYGNGCDLIILKATDKITQFPSDREISGQVDNKIELTNYNTYLIWRELVEVQTVPRPPLEERQPTPVAQWRENKGELALCGTRCNNCGTPQYPPQRVCMICRSKDDFVTYGFSNRQARVFSYSHDYVMETLDPPVTSTVVDFEGGGRMICDMTDRRIDDVQVGMTVEMTFRKLYYVGGIYNYWWKCKPL